jgi:hypothetical protein
MSMSTDPSRSQPQAPRQVQGKPNEAPRDQAEVQSKVKTFAEKLEKLTQGQVREGDSKGSDGKNSDAAQGALKKGPVKGKGEREEKDRDESSGGGGGAVQTATDFAKAVAMASISKPDAMPDAQLARIIAALEELVDKGGTAEYQLTLPAGATTIEGAVIGRDPTGKLNIQLLANAAIPPAAIQQLQTALRMRLNYKKAELGKLDVSYGRKNMPR